MSVCHGCGGDTNDRYCQYHLGASCKKCQGRSDRFYLPARLAGFHDAHRYPVCRVAKAELQGWFHQPLFSEDDRIPSSIKALRWKVYWMGQSKCNVTNVVPKERWHYLTTPTLYSMADLVDLSKHPEHLEDDLIKVVNHLYQHVVSCQPCLQQWSPCTICWSTTNPCYPWDTARVRQCSECLKFMHRTCYEPDKCPSCHILRINQIKL